MTAAAGLAGYIAEGLSGGPVRVRVPREEALVLVEELAGMLVPARVEDEGDGYVLVEAFLPSHVIPFSPSAAGEGRRLADPAVLRDLLLRAVPVDAGAVKDAWGVAELLTSLCALGVRWLLMAASKVAPLRLYVLGSSRVEAALAREGDRELYGEEAVRLAMVRAPLTYSVLEVIR